MTDTTTPGQLAYDAWWRTRWPLGSPPRPMPYADLRDAERGAWEAAAEAVLAQWTPQEEASWTDTPITDQLHAMLRLVGRIFHAGTQRDLDKLQLWLAAYAEAINARLPQESAAQKETPDA